MLECSNCRCEFEGDDSPTAHDGAFSFYCPNCQKGVVNNGDGNERRRQREERELIVEKLERIAESAATTEPGTGFTVEFKHSLEELEEMVSRAHTRIQEEIETRSDD